MKTAQAKQKQRSKLSNSPQHVDEDTWFYEERRGILVVRRVYNAGGEFVQTEQFMIPWSKLRASLNRKDGDNAS